MNLKYHSAGKNCSLQFKSMSALQSSTGGVPRLASARRSSAATLLEGSPPSAAINKALEAIKSDFLQQHKAWNAIRESDTRYMFAQDGKTLIIATDSITVEGVTKTDLKRLKEKFGFVEIQEGAQGKHLLRSQDTNQDALKQGQAAIADVYANAKAGATAHPHFVRAFFRPKPSAAGNKPLWNHHNTGNPGIAGADVAAHAAWLISKGDAAIRVAVLDEGVDSLHPALKASILAEKDVVDKNPHARPDGDDAHGTSCAGIIGSRDSNYPGLASACSLVGVRIAKGDGNSGWIIDDFDTADAIDWSWDDAKADVLSNSWGGGPPVDVIINAIKRSNSKGRGGKGALVVFAAGNSNGSIHFPGNLDSVLTVGASTPWDERKNPKSKDGEDWWGSCYGKELDLLAPGVRIATTDIAGAAGYSPGDYTETFNGTSAATPHVAAAAALVLSVNPNLTFQQVRDAITGSCDPLVQGGKWNKEYGWGRLNIYNALRRAQRLL